MDGGTSESTGGGRSAIVENLGSLEGWWNASGIALWSIVLFGAFLLNATLLLAFLKRPGLRTISNRFVMNLTVSNLLTCAILNPLLMLDSPSSFGTMRTTCAIAESATSLVTSSSVLSVLLIAIDQYLAVVDPLRYRTRIDKLKCGILVVSIWLISLTFAVLAGFNPSPRSLWLVCTQQDEDTLYGSTNETSNDTLNFTLDSSLSLLVDATENYAIMEDLTLTELSRSLHLDDNSTMLPEKKIPNEGITSGVNVTALTPYNLTITYGLVYAMAYALLAYLAPFIGVCWIYVKIYSAAHKNSERTRRTGSRPILSSASFSEEYYPVRQEASSEDFRRIPKISSLSSIDESIETHTPSQTIMPRRCSEYSSNVISYSNETTNETINEEDQRHANVVFTVGSSKVNVKSQQDKSAINEDHDDGDNDDDDDDVDDDDDDDDDDNEKTRRKNLTKDTTNENKVPIAILKAQFLDRDETTSNDDRSLTVKSKFRNEPRQKRKSSHDLMYERMLRGDSERFSRRNIDNDNTSTDDEDYDEDADNDVDNIPRNGVSSSNDVSSINRTSVETNKILDSNEKYDKENRVTKITNETEESNREIRAKITVRPDETRENDTLSANDEPSSRKSSLDYSMTNLPSQSSILKPHNGIFMGKSINRCSANFHRNEQSQTMNNGDEIYGKCLTSNLETNAFGACTTNTPIVTITPPNKSCLQRVSSVRSTSSYINSLKHRISNGSLFKYREETRAARISALVIVMGLICWTPYVIVLILRNISSITGKRISHESDVAAMSFVILATYVSPLLFGYRSRRVKRELRKFFCFRRELSYKNNRSLMAKKVLKRRHSGNMSQLEMDARYNIFNCVYGRTRWPKDKVHFVQVPETALVVETCRSSFSSGASTQISSTSTEEC